MLLPLRYSVRSARLLAQCLLVISLLYLPGCANLAAVRSFAKTSAATADYHQVVLDFESSATRRARYKPDLTNPDYVLRTPQSRADERQRFEEAQAVLVNYMNALGELAAEGQPKLSDNVKGLTAELAKAPFIATGDAKANLTTLSAAGTIVGSLANLATKGSREVQLKQLIRTNDAQVQVLTKGLAQVVAVDFVGSLDEERETADSYFDQVIIQTSARPAPQAPASALGTRSLPAATPKNSPATPPSESPAGGAAVAALTRFLVRQARITHDDATDTRLAQARAYAQVLRKIGAGHAQLLAGLDKLDSTALKASLTEYAQELQQLYQGIQQLR